MKPPKLNWKPVFIVEEWGTEIIEAVGTYLDKYIDGVIEYNDTWLVFINGVIHRKRGYLVYEDRKSAEGRLFHEKKKYLEYCQKQVDEYQEKVKKLKEAP